MKQWLRGIFFGIIAVLVPVAPVLAHPGNTDAYGCHTCRTNCASWGLSTGEYHCHNAKTLPQPVEPISSHYGDDGTGYTTPVVPIYSTPIISTPIVTVTTTTKKKVTPFPLTKKLSTYTCKKDTYNCVNFRTKKQAQSVFNYCKKQTGKRDIHKLDTDKDGKACETL